MNEEKIIEKIAKIKEIVLQDGSGLEKYKQVATTLFQRENKKTLVQPWQVEWMKELRTQGHSYEDIAKIIGLSLSSIRYYLVSGEKEKIKKANEKTRERMKSNPQLWNAYVEYQKEYQRKLAKRKKEEKDKIIILEPVKNENENDNDDKIQTNQ